jgi:Predicted metal-binding protein (DUF2103)
MLKTKTQAQKRQELQARQQAKDVIRLEQQAASALQQRQISLSTDESEPLSRKALRQKKKKHKEQITAEEPPVGEAVLKLPMPVIASTSLSVTTSNTAVTEELISASLKQELSLDDKPEQVRIVQNHSTYCEGLKPILAKLQKHLPKCTILPGPLSQSSSHCETLELRLQRMLDESTYKLVARNGYTSQDVLISPVDTKLFNEELLKENIETVLADKKIFNPQAVSDDICLSQYNRGLAQARQNFWREQHQEQHQQIKEQEKEHKMAEQVKQQRRKLVNKSIPTEKLTDYAARDTQIISGKDRGKYSMR